MEGIYNTPGMYIEEKNAFTNSIVPVPTSVPAFIGYTSKAMKGTKSLAMVPTRITSFTEFNDLFGGAPTTTFELADGNGNVSYQLTNPTSPFYLYNSMKLFYLNGGATCWIVSIGSYGDQVDLAKFKKGLDSLMKEAEPTMLVSPDAMLLKDTDCYAFQKEMIDQAGATHMRDRIAILDIHGGSLEDGKGGYKKEVESDDLGKFPNLFSLEGKLIDKFRDNIHSSTLDFGVAYYPWLHTTTTSAAEVSISNISNLNKLKELIDAEAAQQLSLKTINQERKDQILSETGKLISESQIVADETAILAAANDEDSRKAAQSKIEKAQGNINNIEQALKAVSPLFIDILTGIQLKLNVLPPSGAIAGIITHVDNTMGVGHAPANITLSSVTGPTIDISNEEQEDLNVPLNGKAVNAIRSFSGKGVLIWGARTLNGNSQDWRYINVRRAMIMIEQSIKIALGAFVFKPNNQNTWSDVQSSITSFLTAQWNNGILVGATPSEAFEVSVGLGATMTSNDILDGIMRIIVKLAVVQPAEFIFLTFEQNMPTS